MPGGFCHGQVKPGSPTEPFKKTVRIPWTVLSLGDLPKLRNTVRDIVHPVDVELVESGTTIDGRRVWDSNIERLLNQAGVPTDFAVIGRHTDTEGRIFTVDVDLSPGGASCTVAGHDKARIEGAAVLLS